MRYICFGRDISRSSIDRQQKESDRLDIMHKLTEVTLGGKLNLAPVPSNPQRILDIGTGTGIWAMEMGKILQDLL